MSYWAILVVKPLNQLLMLLLFLESVGIEVCPKSSYSATFSPHPNVGLSRYRFHSHPFQLILVTFRSVCEVDTLSWNEQETNCHLFTEAVR
jgi:hypothetical protein